MRHIVIQFLLFFIIMGAPAHALDIQGLANCTVKVFKEINRIDAWSGKAPEQCPANIYVEKRPTGIFVTTWVSTNSEKGWVRTSFSAAMGFTEIAGKDSLKKASSDITARAARIERCLNSIITVNNPLECRDYAVKSYLAGEDTGTENERLVWLDDNGRHTVGEYSYGDTTSTPSPPADLFSTQELPVGVKLDIHMRTRN
ncbi:MAG: hypothetical protein PHH28_03990 [Desulfuromonadaceae bacterium]|nr:hypothetical protein [Desulfuromonadaceae bacterium]